MISKKLSFVAISIFLLVGNNSESKISDVSKLKVAVGTVVSGAIGGGLATLLTRSGSLDLEMDFHYKWFGLSFGSWNLDRKLVCAAATTVSSLIGAYVSYYYFTPEGKLSTVSKMIQSLDQTLLKMIDSSSNFDQFAKKVQFHYKKYTAFPTILAFEYLEANRVALIEAKAELERMLDLIFDYPQLEDEILENLSAIDLCMPTIERGIDIIRSDVSFEAKWQAYMLEKRLAEMQREISNLKWQMGNNSGPRQVYINNHYSECKKSC